MLIYNNIRYNYQFKSYIMRIKEKKNYKYMCSYIYNNNYPFIKENDILSVHKNTSIIII